MKHSLPLGVSNKILKRRQSKTDANKRRNAKYRHNESNKVRKFTPRYFGGVGCYDEGYADNVNDLLNQYFGSNQT